MTSLGGIDCGFRGRKSHARAGLNLDEAEHIAVPSDQVDLATIAGRAKVRGHDAIALLAQEQIGCGFALAPGAQVFRRPVGHSVLEKLKSSCRQPEEPGHGGFSQHAHCSEVRPRPPVTLITGGGADCRRPAVANPTARPQNRSTVYGACIVQGKLSRFPIECEHSRGAGASGSREGRVKGQFWTAPNQLTLLRLIFIPFVIINVLDGQWLWALGLLIAAGISDALDGLLARALNQRTLLGQYLDPIADKMLLSSLFLVLSFVRKIPWKYTVLVFTRDLLIVSTCVVLYATVGFRDFRPSIFGKLNTICQIAAVLFVILAQIYSQPWIVLMERLFLYATFTFTTISGVHYVLLTGHRLRHADTRSEVSREAN